MAEMYVLRGTESGKVKLGITENFGARLPNYRTHCAEPIEVLTVFEIGGPRSAAERLEQDLLTRWAKYRTHGEWHKPTDDMLAKIGAMERIYAGVGRGIQWTQEDHRQRRGIAVSIQATNFGPADLLVGGHVLARFSRGYIALLVMRSIGDALRVEYSLEADGSGMTSAVSDMDKPYDFNNTVLDESGVWAI